MWLPTSSSKNKSLFFPPWSTVDLSLGSGISASGMHGRGLACGPAGTLPGCVRLTPVRIQQPQVWVGVNH